mmetsp:Transcript_19774/g.50243  ORF Transcript_19774/g.50243 Transcript_19774/m.50243 type:complete len:260 (+) Transcript_19774:121-900(+)
MALSILSKMSALQGGSNALLATRGMSTCLPALAPSSALRLCPAAHARTFGTTRAARAEPLMTSISSTDISDPVNFSSKTAVPKQLPVCDARLVMVAFGPDKPGIVARIGKVVRDCQGYVEVGKMTKLSTFFCVMFETAVPSSQVERCLQDMKSIQDFDVMVQKAEAVPFVEGHKTYEINVTGAHKAGIVANLANVLSSLNININDMKFYTEKKSPFSDTTAFRLIAKVTLPPRVTRKMLEREIMELADAMELEMKFSSD